MGVTATGTRILKQNRKEYIDSMKQAFSQADEYECKYGIGEIELDEAEALSKQSAQ